MSYALYSIFTNGAGVIVGKYTVRRDRTPIILNFCTLATYRGYKIALISENVQCFIFVAPVLLLDADNIPYHLCSVSLFSRTFGATRTAGAS